jgi:hypothetical protein
VLLGNVHIQVVPGREVLLAILARIVKCTRVMDILNMLPQVATILAGLAAQGAFMQVGRNVIPDDILIKQPVVT